MSNGVVPVNGARIKQIRLARGWTQKDLARKSGYSERLIRKAESGGSIETRTLLDLCEALSNVSNSVSIQDLLQDNLQLAKQFIYALGTLCEEMGDYIRPCISDDFVLNVPGDPNSAPFIGQWQGAAGLDKFAKLYYSLAVRDPKVINATYAVGDSFVTARYVEKVLVGGVPIKPFWVNLHFQFKDGLITRVDDEYDTKAASDIELPPIKLDDGDLA